MRQTYETSHEALDLLPVHRHAEAYLTLVLDGAYTEFGPDGPVACEPGVLVLHPPFHLHGDRFDRHRVKTLNVAVPDASPAMPMAMRRVADPGRVRTQLQRHPEAWRSVWDDADASTERRARACWQLRLVERLRTSEEDAAEIAAAIGVSAEHASRTLARTHGAGPRALRAEWRFRRALAALDRETPLAHVAADAGYADQAHFTRACSAMTGLTPAMLRRRIKSVQSGAAGMG